MNSGTGYCAACDRPFLRYEGDLEICVPCEEQVEQDLLDHQMKVQENLQAAKEANFNRKWANTKL